MCRLGFRHVRIRTSNPPGTYMGPPLNRQTIEGLAAHDTRERGPHTSVDQVATNNKITVLAMNPVRKTGRVNTLAIRHEHEFTK